MSDIIVQKMEKRHIDGVCAVENESFTIPWTRSMFVREFEDNGATKLYYAAISEGGGVCGYSGMWQVVNEGYITNVAVLPEFRRMGIGGRLLAALEAEARAREMIGLTLECRIGNLAAQRLYTKNGFKPEGIRKRYYSDTNEDAIIMWKYFDKNSGLGGL